MLYCMLLFKSLIKHCNTVENLLARERVFSEQVCWWYNLCGHNPMQPVLGDPALAEELDEVE